MGFEHYVLKGQKQMRCGFTTGSCATLAAKAAATYLLTGHALSRVDIVTPKGIPVIVPVKDAQLGTKEGRDGKPEPFACCGVEKDAGDDPDITGGLLVFAEVTRKQQPGIEIEGGIGVGRVTRKGLEQPVGAAAINNTPRRMIEQELVALCEAQGYKGGLRVLVSIPRGEEVARKTFNPSLGIEGGLSVLGTSGIVEPMSVQALIDSIEVEMQVLAENGHKDIIVTPGNYGQNFLKKYPSLGAIPQVKCSNFIGATLDFAVAMGFENVLLVGHLGKFIKLAGGIMDTHSKTADCRMDLLALHTALSGGALGLVQQVMTAVTVDEAIEMLDEFGLREPVLASATQRITFHLERRVSGAFETGVVLFSNSYDLLGTSSMGEKIIARWENKG